MFLSIIKINRNGLMDYRLVRTDNTMSISLPSYVDFHLLQNCPNKKELVGLCISKQQDLLRKMPLNELYVVKQELANPVLTDKATY
uniref:Acetyltransferase n=1 Tax=Heterorhabditis bacteriophora TaxID=37862 RepID=A0A1I7XQQ4_HETBA